MVTATNSVLILFLCFGFLLVIGMPISIGIGMSAFFTALTFIPADQATFTMAQKMVGGVDSFSLLAIPLFVLSGNIMNNGGIARKLVNLAKVIGGFVPGALLQANVLGNMLFGSLSGSAVAAAAAIGGTMAPMEEEEGYDPALSAAVNIASSPTGMLIPPSGALIMYSTVAGGVSISALFIAGYIPGILMGVAVMIVALFQAKQYNLPKTKNDISFFKAFIDALPSLGMIVVVIGGIVGGLFTATEAAAVSVLYTVVLSLVYKSLTFESFKEILIKTASTTGVIMFLVSASSAMSWVMAYTQIPVTISTAIMGISNNPVVILLSMNLMLLVVGTFMDITPALLIFTPILLPIAKALGMHEVHFGIMIVFNLCIGIMTPPVGSALFVGCNVSKVSIEKAIKPLIPHFIALIIALMMITFIPEISMFLVRILKLV